MPRVFICWIGRDRSIQTLRFSTSSYPHDLHKAREYCDRKDITVGNWIRKSYYYFRDDLYPERKRQEFMQQVNHELLQEEKANRQKGKWGKGCPGERCASTKSYYLNLRDCKYYCFHCASKITLKHGEGIFEYHRKEPLCPERIPGTPQEETHSQESNA